MRADFKRKEPRVAAKQCVVEKTIILPAEKYDYFTQNLLQDYDFIDQNRALMGEWDGAWHCLLVTGKAWRKAFWYRARVPPMQDILLSCHPFPR